MVELVWLIPALPIAGFLLLLFFGKRIGEPVAGWIGTAAVALSFITSLVVFAGLWNQPVALERLPQYLGSIDGHRT